VSKTFIRGNTFPVKEELKKLGCHWNSDEKCWVAFSDEAAAKAKALVEAAPEGWVPAPRGTAPAAGVTPGATRADFNAKAGVQARLNAQEAHLPQNAAQARVAPGSKIVLSEEQLAILQWGRTGKGHLVIRARAGTGKTFISVKLFDECPEEAMCYLVYNSRNRVEAKEKISNPRVDVHSQNSLGYRFVREVWPKAKPEEGDPVEYERVERACGKDTPAEVQSQVYRLVGFAKNTTIDPSVEELADICEERDIRAEAFEDEGAGGWLPVKLARCAKLVLDYSLEKDPENRISFNDQVWLPVRKNWAHPCYDLILVDEAQDTNVVQLTMAKRALRPTGRMVVVGDDCQAIYDFRGAASDSLDMLKAELHAAELGLTVTRRCPKKTVELVAKSLVPDYKAEDDAPEGQFETIVETVLLDWAKPGDAILSRINAPLMGYCLQLLKRGTPARIQGRDIGASLRATVRKMKAKSVPHFLTKLEAWADKQKNRFKNTKRYEQKCEEINDTRETLAAVAEGAASVAEIEARISRLFQDNDKESGPAVVLSSVHKAKGLEWDRIFLLERTFNRKRPVNAPPPTARQVKEEKNIRYVALTRTKSTTVFCMDPSGSGQRNVDRN